jgi:hypothetical protein
LGMTAPLCKHVRISIHGKGIVGVTGTPAMPCMKPYLLQTRSLDIDVYIACIEKSIANANGVIHDSNVSG